MEALKPSVEYLPITDDQYVRLKSITAAATVLSGTAAEADNIAAVARTTISLAEKFFAYVKDGSNGE